jgi:hypothetical protein
LTTRPPVTSRQGMMRLASMGRFEAGQATGAVPEKLRRWGGAVSR